MPFFALLSIYSIWRVWQNQESKWLIVIGVCIAFVLQSHYLGLLLIPTLGIFWILTFYKLRQGKINPKYHIRYTIYGAILFGLLMSPLVIFDFRHNFINYNAIKLFFTERQTTVSARPWSALPNIWPLLQDVATRLLAGRNEWLGSWVSVGIVASLLLLIKSERFKLQDRSLKALILIFIWLGVSLVGLGVYKQHIYDHYYGFFFPAPFLLFAGVAQTLITRAKIRGLWLVSTAMVFLVYFNMLDNPLQYPPNRQLQRSVEVANKIKNEASGQKFNLAVIAERNYEDAYQYFLERDKAGVVDIDPLNYKATRTNQLFVVCEMPMEKCNPTNSPKAEVANFGWSKIEEDWEVMGVTIFKLVPAQ